MSDLQELSLEEELMNELESKQAELEKLLDQRADLQNRLEQTESKLSEKDLLLSEALEQAEKWKRQAQSRPDQSQQLQSLQSQISELSSANSTLMSELRKKSEIIVQLNEKQEIYNKSDLIRKQNAELEKRNRELEQSEQNARREARASIEGVKREYAEKERELAHIQYEAEASRSQAEATRRSQNELIKKKAKEMYQSKEASLKSAYKSKEMALEGAFFGSLAYGVLVTLFTAVRSRAFISDFKSFFIAIWNFVQSFADFAIDGAKWASQLGDMIPQPIVATIVHWLVLIVVLVLLCGGLGALVIGGSIYVFKGYTEKLEFADTWSLLVFLVSLALSIFFADEIRAFVPINLLLLNILVHALYVLIRWYVKGCRQSRGYY